MPIQSQISNQLRYSILFTPIGPLMVVYSDKGVVRIYLRAENEGEMIEDVKRRYPKSNIVAEKAQSHLAVLQLQEYFDKNRRMFSTTLDLQLTAFQKRALNLVQKIPYGETRTYGQIARELGMPGAARAVGMANRKNPVPIIIPCHRVIGVDGKMVGYAGKDGIETKAWLLRHEGVDI